MTDREKNNPDFASEIKTTHHQMPRWIVLIFILGVFIFLAIQATGLLIVLLLSGVLAYILSDIINKAESLGIKRNVAVILLYSASAALVLGAETLLSPYLQNEIKLFYARLPIISQRIEDILNQRSLDIIRIFPQADEMIRKFLSEVINPGILISRTMNLSEIFSNAASFLLGVILVPFFVFFLLKDWPRISKTLMGWVPSAYVETTVSLLSEVNILVGRYLRGLTLDCIVVAVIATFGLWLTGINYPISLGILTGAANVVPYLGPLTAASAACLFALIQFNSIGAVLKIAMLYITIRVLDDLVIAPLTIGKIVKLHPMLLVITIILGHELFGVIGMVVAVPFVTTLQKVLRILIENRRHKTAKSVLKQTGTVPV